MEQLMGAIEQYTNIADFVNAIFKARKLRNASYSLRAFARDVNLAAGILSNVMNGKRTLSYKNALKMIEALELSSEEAVYFIDLVTISGKRLSRGKKDAESRLLKAQLRNAYTELDEEEFFEVCDITSMIALELLRTKKGKSGNVSWLSEKLKISEKDVFDLLLKLVRLGLMDEIEGKFEIKKANISISSKKVSARIQAFHERMLEYAKLSVKEQKPEVREISSNFIILKPENIDAVKSELKAFRRQLQQKYDTDHGSKLYGLTSQFFLISDLID